MNYKIPDQAKIGHVHLKVADIPRALAFYVNILGFQITQWYGDSAVFIAAGGYHHHIGLNNWYSKNAGPAPVKASGLYHLAIVYPERKDLAVALQHILQAQYPITGASDHGVSEALYLNDPDGNGVELYWDKPKEQWPVDENGRLKMITESLDIEALLSLVI